MNDDSLDYIRQKLEEGEGIAPDALARLLAAARQAKLAEGRADRRAAGFRARNAFLLAASLVLACCGWFVKSAVTARREAAVTNVIALLRAAEGAQPDEKATLAEALVAWQEAPCLEPVN